ncbi:MAG: hypothetical protein Fur0021_15880 [Candidatus Promineifilaceae bacterium]
MSPNAHDKRHLEQNSYFKDKSHPQKVTFPTVPHAANPINWGQVRWLPVSTSSLNVASLDTDKTTNRQLS